jgi:general nucleoside transport system ATP-binding protein
MKGITKRFGDNLANHSINFNVDHGEVHALLGQNGAGKTTLMNILYGLYRPDEGKIFLDRNPVTLSSPHKAIEHHIGMIHQHFMLIPRLSVTENIMLGFRSSRHPLLDMKEAESRVEEISQKYELPVDPKAMIADLPVGLQQRVEIIKALFRKTDLLILDEPTSVLTPVEAGALFRVIDKLKEEGLSVIFITHKLKEVMRVSDRITVLRQGAVIDTLKKSETTPEELARMMVGGSVRLRMEKSPIRRGKKLLEIRNLSAHGEQNRPLISDISFDIHGGEVLGVAGADGNGQNELAEAIAGLRRTSTGQIIVNGKDVTNDSPRKRIGMKLSYVPSDARGVGLILGCSVAENMVLKKFRESRFSQHHFLLDSKRIERFAEENIRRFNIAVRSCKNHVSTLSGGNQQKVCLAREISDEPDVLIASQPTRGLDVASITQIHESLLRHREGGKAILLISSELDEILALSDRIAVLYEGRIVGFVPAAEDIDLEKISLMMAGIHQVLEDER